MPSEAASPPLTVTVLAALWVTLGRCGVFGSPGQGCDDGKLFLNRDLPADAVYSDCVLSAWPESTQILPSIDTVYDPEPVRQTCMDKPISYHHRIPNSGEYRPVRAESGEYLYCPPQRWLNNLRHGAAVLLYHPCAPLQERRILASLARSCLPHYVLTPHPQLNKHMPVAFVSWGRTLELSTTASLDICDWLEVTQTSRKESDVATPMRKYNLLMTWSAEAHRLEETTKMKDSVRQCCKQTICSLLSSATEAQLEPSKKDERSKEMKVGSKSRRIRAAFTDFRDGQNISSTLSPSAESLQVKRKLLDLSSQREAPQIQNQTQGHKPRPTAPLGLNMSETEDQKGRPILQPAPLQPRSEQSDLRNLNHFAVSGGGVSNKQNHTDRPDAQTLSFKNEGTVKQKESDNIKVDNTKEKDLKDHATDGKVKKNEVVDVKERELEQTQIHSAVHSRHKSESTGSESVFKPQSEDQPQQHSQAASHSQPLSRDCDSCTPGEHCDCPKASEAEAQAAAVRNGLQRTPRTDEAVWAAAALGFLLVLLALSVLHTRLYRHWRTTPSLYWHDPSQDYDSVADVIRRRLRIAKRRRKRGRRQECVLLPSSSSSDEHP